MALIPPPGYYPMPTSVNYLPFSVLGTTMARGHNCMWTVRWFSAEPFPAFSVGLQNTMSSGEFRWGLRPSSCLFPVLRYSNFWSNSSANSISNTSLTIPWLFLTITRNTVPGCEPRMSSVTCSGLPPRRCSLYTQYGEKLNPSRYTRSALGHPSNKPQRYRYKEAPLNVKISSVRALHPLGIVVPPDYTTSSHNTHQYHSKMDYPTMLNALHQKYSDIKYTCLTYTCVEGGIGNAPLWTGTYTLGTFSMSGAPRNNKKQAQQAAALAMINHLNSQGKFV